MKIKQINPHIYLLYNQQNWIDYVDSLKAVREHIGVPTTFPCLVTTFLTFLDKGSVLTKQAEHRFIYTNSIKELTLARQLANNILLRIEV